MPRWLRGVGLHPLPASVEYVSLSGSVHTTNEQYDSVNHTVTFTLDDPLAAGTVCQVVFKFVLYFMVLVRLTPTTPE